MAKTKEKEVEDPEINLRVELKYEGFIDIRLPRSRAQRLVTHFDNCGPLKLSEDKYGIEATDIIGLLDGEITDIEIDEEHLESVIKTELP